MSERGAVLVAAGAFAGALAGVPVPWWIVGAAGIAAVTRRSPLAAALLVALLCSALAERSWAGLEPGPAREIEGQGTLVIDPERTGASTRAVARVDGRRYLVAAYGGAGGRLAQGSAGDRVTIEGRTSAYQGPDERRAALHVGERLSARRVTVTPSASPLWRVANGLRSLIAGGASSLGQDRAALFTGIVYGDDRGQAVGTEVDFRLAGLTHLLAVSGQNVAYTLTVARPLIQRRTRSGRWVMTITVLVVFAAATRFEPSVLRATVMAAIAVSARTLGREASAGRALALAVTVLLLIDPLLASTVAFRLSVAASAGIVWLADPICGRLAGPRWIREPLAVTLAAQLAVAPLLITTFGPVSPVSIPANLVAGPIAGAVMAWGMTGGLLAGMAGDHIAALVHVPTRGALAALEAVAAAAARAPVAHVDLRWLVAALVLWAGRAWWRVSVPAIAAAGLATLALAWALIPGVPPGTHEVGWESRVVVHPGGVVLELGEEGRPARLLEDLAVLGVRRIDVVVAPHDSSSLALVRARVAVGEVRPPSEP